MKKYLLPLLVLLLTACNLNLQYHGNPQAWIDAPLDGSVLPLAAYNIIAHATDPAGISQIEVSINGSIIGTIGGSGFLFTATQPWTPAAPGEYVILARGRNSGGDWSDYVQARVTVQGEANSTEPILTVAANASPTSSIPTLVLNKNANCREGPSQLYEVMNSALSGQAVPIVGKNGDGTWWLVRLPSGELCWISGAIGNEQGNAANIPVATARPEPTPTQEEQEQGCFVFDPNQQMVCTVPCPPNAQPGGACTP